MAIEAMPPFLLDPSFPIGVLGGPWPNYPLNMPLGKRKIQKDGIAGQKESVKKLENMICEIVQTRNGPLYEILNMSLVFHWLMNRIAKQEHVMMNKS